MQHTTRILTVLVTTCLLAAPLAAAGNGPEAREESDKVVLQNDDVTVWFQGKKPFLKVFPTGGDADGSDAFSVKFSRVVEFRDANENGAPDEGETVAFLNLEPANAWNVDVTGDEDNAVITLNLQAPVRHRGPVPGVGDDGVELPTRDANVSLVFHVYDRSTEVVTGSNVTVPVASTSVKYDFLVHQWPWVSAEDHRLALELVTSGELTDVESGEIGAATVAANDTAVGALTWTDTAEGITQDGENVTVNVSVHVPALEESEDENATTNESRLAFVYDAPNLASLVHDPTIGIASVDGSGANEAMGDIGERLKDVPATGTFLGIAAVAGVAALVGVRRRG